MSNTSWGDFFAGVITGVVLGAIALAPIMNGSWETSTVEHGCAYYDTKTAKFTWRNNEPD